MAYKLKKAVEQHRPEISTLENANPAAPKVAASRVEIANRAGTLKITASGITVFYKVRVLFTSEDGLRMFVINEKTKEQTWCDAANVVLDKVHPEQI